ncbi:hypothetical protein [Faecalimonas umbilicata]|jgi:hypothetical protein|uniref:hypothetical protein n=1 Tax=Faecalimonas umbilicata TaxID=1912855 RepID=UPI0022E97D80|nr:hypothetical protein [Faecalimonas umbilicata]MBS5088962.1 hypothetical protein [Clostridiaceae bacterium]
MKKIMKSFRLSEEAVRAIEERDPIKYRSAQEYIEDLLLNSAKRTSIEDVLKESKEIKQEVAELKSEIEILYRSIKRLLYSKPPDEIV